MFPLSPRFVCGVTTAYNVNYARRLTGEIILLACWKMRNLCCFSRAMLDDFFDMRKTRLRIFFQVDSLFFLSVSNYLLKLNFFKHRDDFLIETERRRRRRGAQS